MTIFKLTNVIQHYDWGSQTALKQFFGLENPYNEPQAEIWMGAHPNGCSLHAETGEKLSDIIAQDKQNILGDKTMNQFGELPYLFKVLAADKPLSIQVHPNRDKSKIGFERENLEKVPLNAPNRNYKDPNHKPELVYALSNYKAMNGFRPIAEMVALFQELNLESLRQEVNQLVLNQNSDGLKIFFTHIMQMTGEKKKKVLKALEDCFSGEHYSKLCKEALGYSRHFAQYFSDDVGLLAPFILNTIELLPGEAMFLYAETPHAYVQGTALEIMANSDNVLRAGLTPKHIDVDELLDNVRFESTPLASLKMEPLVVESVKTYPIPVDDFGFSVGSVDAAQVKGVTFKPDSAEIVMCTAGKVSLSNDKVDLELAAGESVFIANTNEHYHITGQGQFARAFN